MDATVSNGRGAGKDAWRPRGSKWGLIAAALVVAVGSAPAFAEAIALRRTATVTGAQVRLGDVATLSDGAEVFADVLVGRLDAGGELNVSIKEIQNALIRQGGNLASVELRGFDVCHITRPATPSTQKPAGASATAAAKSIDEKAAPALANPSDEVAKDGQLTVRDHVMSWLEQWSGASRSELRVNFAERDAKDLGRALLNERLAITPGGVNKLGRIPLVIQRFAGEKFTGTDRITVDVARRQLALVARRAINKGAAIDVGDVEVREVYLDRDRGAVIIRMDQAVGLIASVSLREGSVIGTDDVAPALLVRKNENIRVRVHAGSLLVQTVARALEDGGMGQIIPVRNDRSHETFLIEVSGLRSGMVIADESPVKAGAKSASAPAKSEKAPVKTDKAAARR